MNLTRLMSVAVLAVAFATPAVAHPSFASEFDANKPVTLEGTVTKVEWANPHIWMYLDVKNADGALQAKLRDTARTIEGSELRDCSQ